MDRKKNNNAQGGRTNGNNKPKPTDNKALADTTLGLTNLNLGTNANSKPKNNNSGKKTSKKSTSSSNGSTVAASSPVSSKKAGPILLGMPDSPMESEDDIDPYVTKIGGVPVSKPFRYAAEDEKLLGFYAPREPGNISPLDLLTHAFQLHFYNDSCGCQRIYQHLPSTVSAKHAARICTYSFKHMYPSRPHPTIALFMFGHVTSDSACARREGTYFIQDSRDKGMMQGCNHWHIVSIEVSGTDEFFLFYSTFEIASVWSVH